MTCLSNPNPYPSLATQVGVVESPFLPLNPLHHCMVCPLFPRWYGSA